MKLDYEVVGQLGFLLLLIGFVLGNPLTAVLGGAAVAVAVYNLAVEKDNQPPSPPAVS